MNAGIKTVTVKIEPDDQMSSLMIATTLRQMAQRIEDENQHYTGPMVFYWIREDADHLYQQPKE